jgi:tryptophan synthase alpha chain
MSRISDTFKSLASAGSGAYIPYVCAGDPDSEFTMDLVDSLCKGGADIVELGLPFSDPVADGPVIQGAMSRALSAGFRVTRLFETVSAIRSSGLRQPIVLMTYYNPVVRMGVGTFCARLAKAGGDAVLVVDLPIEESRELDEASADHGLDVIRLIAPNTDDERMDLILERTTGFAYAVSVAGITGSRATLASSALSLLSRMRSKSRIPIAIGFGISYPDQVHQAILAGASGVVEGSALIPIYSEENKSEALDLIEKHAREMKAATRI